MNCCQGMLNHRFVWAQHAGASKAAIETTGPMRQRWADALATGESRGGVAFAHLNRPGTPTLERNLRTVAGNSLVPSPS